MKRCILFIFLSLSLIFCSFENSDAVMEDYCLVPPYVVQNISPNVMIVLDNSGSMFNFAYSDGFTTTTTADDNPCYSSGSPCTEFSTPGAYPAYQYYGYFNPDYWYDYQSNRFIPTAPKTGSGLTGERAKLSSEWDGNFLNWLTMRRIDIIRKVMTGGKTTTGEGSGFDRLNGEVADCDSRGKYKKITNADLYTPYSGTRKLYVYSASAGCGGGGSGTSSFSIRNDTGGSDGTGNEGTWNVTVRVPSPVEGVVQSVVGTRARLGLSFYKTNAPRPQGGFVQVNVSGGSLSSTVNQINLTRPSTNTPLAETLWTVAGYFAQTASMESGPGPRYSSADYTINNTADPYNYGTGGQPSYPSCAKSFVLYITDGEPCADGYLPATLKSYANGRSNYDCYDLNPGNPGRGGYCPAVGSFAASTFPTCNGGWQGGYVSGMEDVALYVHTNDLRTAATKDITGKQVLTLYSVFAFGKGSTLLRYAAINGGFEDFNGNDVPDLQSEWDNNGDGEPDNFYEAVDGQELEKSIRDAFSSILKRAASGTAASVLASGEGSGANLIQAVFYPRKRIGNDIIGWAGVVQDLWYYVDPLYTNSSVREDTVKDNILSLPDDNIVSIYFDTTDQMVKAKKYDSDQDGNIGALNSTILFEDLKNLWEAGKILWQRDLTAEPRTIYTTTDGSSLFDFSVANAGSLSALLDVQDENSDLNKTDDAEYLIRYIHGEDFIGMDRNVDGTDDFRSRTVSMDGVSNTWKLGDIINSTPKIVSWYRLNRYDRDYGDTTYGPCDDPLAYCQDPSQSDTADPNHFITTQAYKDRDTVYVGGNDGMLHAFRLGTLRLKWAGKGNYEAASLDSSGEMTGLGEERWAFIPKNALPYLRYQKEQDYCHLYTVDLTPTVFDASINGSASAVRDVNSWKTILIGGMRLGGASSNAGSACTDCVKTPINGVGYSSYYALDVSDENNPQLLWEFTDPDLGYATTGPAVIRIGAKDTNGSWFVVLGSGPTGPISSTGYQFMGRSDQNLKLFILDLKTGALLTTIDTGLTNAFAGTLINSNNDVDDNYQDEVLYIGYVTRNRVGSNYFWNNGGIGRLVTKEDANPGNWVWSKVMDGIGPVTAGITRLRDKKQDRLWLFSGTGRYYFSLDTENDDPDGQRYIFGFKDPCYVPNSGYDKLGLCTTTVDFNTFDLRTVTGFSAGGWAEPSTGWKWALDGQGSGTYPEGDPAVDVTKNYFSERMVSDPFTSKTGCTFFTTFRPYNEQCSIGGESFIWVLDYKTGGRPNCDGKLTFQVSTGAIQEVNIDDIPGPKSVRTEGKPAGGQGAALQSGADPTKLLIHKRKK